MAITFPYSGSAHNSATLSFSTSSDVLSTDAIWCIIGINLTGNTITPPSGFTELTLSGGNNTAGNLAQIRIYYNLAPAASTTYNATHGASGRSDLAWVQVRGSDNSSIANHVNTSVGGAKAAAENQTSTSITTTNATTTLLGFIGFRAFPVNGIASGASFTEIVDSVGADGSTNIHQELAYRDVTSTGTYAYAATLNPADGEPVIIGTIALNPTGGGAQNVTASGIVSSEALGNAAVTSSYTLSINGVVSAERLGSATVTNINTINANGIITAERTGTPTLSTTYTINANGIVSTERSGPTAVTSVISGNGITSSEKLGALGINLTVTPAGIRSNEQLGAPTITPGSVTVNTAGIVSAETFGSVSVILAQSVAAAGIVSDSAVGSATITVGPVTINASGIVSSESFGTAQLSVSITPAGISSSEGVGSPTITITAAGISAGNITSSERVGSPTISTSVNVAVHGVWSTEQVGNGTLYRQVAARGIGGSEKFGSPNISVGPVVINASGIFSVVVLGSPIVTAIPLIPPVPDTRIKMRIGQTILSNDAGQSTVRLYDAETLIAI